jgi:hypothetical protein
MWIAANSAELLSKNPAFSSEFPFFLLEIQTVSSMGVRWSPSGPWVKFTPAHGRSAISVTVSGILKSTLFYYIYSTYFIPVVHKRRSFENLSLSLLIHYAIYCSMHRLELLKKCTKRKFLTHLCIQSLDSKLT